MRPRLIEVQMIPTGLPETPITIRLGYQLDEAHRFDRRGRARWDETWFRERSMTEARAARVLKLAMQRIRLGG